MLYLVLKLDITLRLLRGGWLIIMSGKELMEWNQTHGTHWFCSSRYHEPVLPSYISVKSNVSCALPASSTPAEHILSTDTLKPLEESTFLDLSSRSSPDLEIMQDDVVDFVGTHFCTCSSASDDLIKLRRMYLLTLCPCLSVPCPCFRQPVKGLLNKLGAHHWFLVSYSCYRGNVYSIRCSTSKMGAMILA